jgi:hypothetical protein
MAVALQVPTSFAKLVHSMSGGNPLFTKKFVQGLLAFELISLEAETLPVGSTARVGGGRLPSRNSVSGRRGTGVGVGMGMGTGGVAMYGRRFSAMPSMDEKELGEAVHRGNKRYSSTYPSLSSLSASNDELSTAEYVCACVPYSASISGSDVVVAGRCDSVLKKRWVPSWDAGSS